jgi:hypothetical protein
MKRILFIVKKGQQYSGNYGYASSGLCNSAIFVADMLRYHGVDAKFVQVVDNNDIDREVTQNHPDVVVIEALWVVPGKFEVLRRLHPEVLWVVRVHSEVPFLAQEGIAIRWLFEYLNTPNVFVAFNSSRSLHDFMRVSWSDKLLYLPNYFPKQFSCYDYYDYKTKKSEEELHVGCFGAIRPLKNQLLQAMAAIRYADLENKHLDFHMNTSRVEGGEEVLKNIRSLFAKSTHSLIEHEWLSHSRFQHLLSRMDLVMCVSLSETFCIVAADAASLGVPLVCSPEVRWSSRMSQANPTNMDSILEAMYRVGRISGYLDKRGLREYNSRSEKVWLSFLE